MNAKFLSQTNASTGTTPLFQRGAVVATPGALDLFDRAGMNATAYLTRHQTGDFGTLSPPDLHENHVAITYGVGFFQLTTLVANVCGLSRKPTALVQRCCFRRSTEHEQTP